MARSVYVDLRCLQDPAFQGRGIGRHVASLLRTRAENVAWTVIGLVDESLGPLPAEYAALVDEIALPSNASVSDSRAIYIDCSPMTHDPRFSLRFTSNASFLKAAIVYDFIPFGRPGYLVTQAARTEYLLKLARLRNFNFYLAISSYSAGRLSEILGISRREICVTGAAVRNSLLKPRTSRQSPSSPYDRPDPYFFSMGGGDRRKNTEAAVSAVRRLNETQPKKIRLKVAGGYGPSYKSDLLGLAGHAEGEGFLEFLSAVADDDLADLYAGSIATIVPSYIEGFSLPVVEAPACGAPVIASVCGAHLELITPIEATFVPDNYQELAAILERIAQDPAWRSQLLTAQAKVAEDFQETHVGARFWNGLAERDADYRRRLRGYSGLKLKKPKVAFLTPYPPEQTGVARYSQLTIEAAAHSLDVDLYTNAPRPIAVDYCQDAGTIGGAPFVEGAYDAVISVIGNSDFHTPIFEVFERLGGPCILHDSRLTHIYLTRLGPKRFLEFASTILGRPVTIGEVEIWVQDENLPSLFVEPIIERARPLIVHTREYQKLLYERHGVKAELVPCCPTMQFSGEELSSASRANARQSLRVPSATFLISTFGFIARVKGFQACIQAIGLLRGWNVPAELHFVGCALGEGAEVERIASECGVAEHIHWSRDFVDERTYRQFLVASDAAIQLRSYGFGQYSAALGDCISAALPSIATIDLAASCGAPGYVRTVPDHTSALLLAEQLAKCWEDRTQVESRMDARRQYLAEHNFAVYVKRLQEILDLM
jgi:glycosyltransferase involved in cell wall biosynthesis